MIDLGDFLNRPYGSLSGGQKRRADIARALMHQPVLLFLDEPTAGLDPQSREQVWETIHSLRSTQGLTVFLTTHYMEETEKADRISIIHAGELVVQGTPAELRNTHSSSILSGHLGRSRGTARRLLPRWPRRKIFCGNGPSHG